MPDYAEDLTDIKVRLDVQSAKSDGTLEIMVKSARATLERLIGQGFWQGPQDVTRLLSGNGRDRIVLPDWPIISIASVTIGTAPIPAATAATDSGWILDMDNGILELRGYTFNRGMKNISIVLTKGWALPPDDVVDLMRAVVTAKYRRMQNPTQQSAAAGKETVSVVPEDFTKLQISTLGTLTRFR